MHLNACSLLVISNVCNLFEKRLTNLCVIVIVPFKKILCVIVSLKDEYWQAKTGKQENTKEKGKKVLKQYN